MNIDFALISRVAELARLDLTDAEKAAFATQISDVLNYVNKVNELDTTSVKAADHVVDLTNVFRNDTCGISLDRSDIEAMAPRFTDGHFVVPKIIDGGE